MQTCRALEGFAKAMTNDFIVGLGSNLGDRGGYLAASVARMATLPRLQITALSKVYETEAMGPPQPRYLNAAIRVVYDQPAEQLLQQLLRIEHHLGRTRDVRWGPRVIDLDILWSRTAVLSPKLTVPHIGLRERAFALAPLLDVAAELDVEYGDSLRRLGGAPEVCGCLSLEGADRGCRYVSDASV